MNNNNLGANPENLKLLGEGIFSLPNKLHHLTLDLSWNNLKEKNIQKFKDEC